MSARTVHKYPILVVDEQIVQMPIGAEILCAQVQCGTICLWALVEPNLTKEPRRIEIVGTGHEIDEADRKYIGTVQMRDGALVWHVFERP